jgi:hypothetical protein
MLSEVARTRVEFRLASSINLNTGARHETDSHRFPRSGGSSPDELDAGDGGRADEAPAEETKKAKKTKKSKKADKKEEAEPEKKAE